MLQLNKKKIVLLLVYISFFIAIPIIKNETRLIEKKIQNHKAQIILLEKNLSESYLEFQYLSSPEVLEKKVIKNIDINIPRIIFLYFVFIFELILLKGSAPIPSNNFIL